MIVALDRGIDIVPRLDRYRKQLQPWVRIAIAWSLPALARRGRAARAARAASAALAGAQLATELASLAMHTRLRDRLLRRLRHSPSETTNVLRRVAAVQRGVAAVLPVHPLYLDLSGLDLTDIRLDGGASAVFQRSDLSDTTASDLALFGDFRAAQFDRVAWRRASLVAVDVSGSSFQHAGLDNVVVKVAYAAGADFRGATLTRVTFSGVRLSGADLRGCVLDDVVFENCELDDADFTGATLRCVGFVGVTPVGVRGLVTPATGGRVSFAVDGDGRPTDEPAAARGAWFPSAPRRAGTQGGGLATSLRVHLERGMQVGRPPLPYRLETFARQAMVWLALGRRYQETRRNALAEVGSSAQAKLVEIALPRHPVLAALGILAGAGPISMRDAFEFHIEVALADIDAALGDDGASNPLEVIVLEDGNIAVSSRRLAESVVVTITAGSLVRMIRWGRYAVAWLVPEAVAFDEDDPHRTACTAQRYADLLVEASRQRPDLEDLPRVQIQGLRSLQADALFGLWLRFVLLHELAHHRPDAESGLPDDIGDHDRDELACDVFAAGVVAGMPHLDGDGFLAESVAELGAGDTPIATITGDAGWAPTAVAALVLLLGAGIGYRSGGPVRERVELIVQAAFGDDVVAALRRDAADPATFIGMLWQAAAQDCSGNSGSSKESTASGSSAPSTRNNATTSSRL